MKISAHLKNERDLHEITVQTDASSKQISIAPKASGFGSSVNGAELLLLSIATCFCNDIYREADKRRITVQGIEVTVTGEFGGEGEPGSNFEYKTAIRSDAPPSELKDMIDYVNEIAEIHRTLRNGINVKLVGQ